MADDDALRRLIEDRVFRNQDKSQTPCPALLRAAVATQRPGFAPRRAARSRTNRPESSKKQGARALERLPAVLGAEFTRRPRLLAQRSTALSPHGWLASSLTAESARSSAANQQTPYGHGRNRSGIVEEY
jgi:hypothetical protein